MGKCVCVGSQPVYAMKYAMGLIVSGEWEGVCCLLGMREGYVCSREIGHGGPCVACVRHGFPGSISERHNITDVRGVSAP